MRKLLSIIFSVACVLTTGASFISCKDEKLKLNQEYVYTDISFKKVNGLTLEDISTFIPSSFVTGSEIKSIAAFEKLLRDNLDTYSIERTTENGSERIYIKPYISSVRITEGYSLWLKYENEAQELRYEVSREGDTFTCLGENAEIKEFYFSDGALHYDLEFNDKFAVVYHYEIR